MSTPEIELDLGPDHWWERAWRLWVPLTILLVGMAISIVGWVLVTELRASAAQSACARRLNADVINADHDWFDAASKVLDGELSGRAAIAQRFAVVNARQTMAVQRQKDFATHPKDGCPLPAKTVVTTTTVPATTTTSVAD